MDEELKELWEKTLDIIKGELSEVSFNTWIKSCEPISMSSNIIKISVPNAFTQEILEKRYKDLVANSIKAICSKLYNIEFLIASEIQNSEEDESEKKHNNLKSNKKVIVFVFKVDNPTYQQDEDGKIQCIEARQVKQRIRGEYATKIDGYFFDNLIHISDNVEESKKILKDIIKKINNLLLLKQ